MKYTPKDIPEGINVARTNHLHEFLILAVSLVGILVGGYFLLGFAADQMVVRLSPTLETRLGRLFPESWNGKEAKNAELQRIVDGLVKNVTELRLPLRANLLCSKEINAFAYPGGNILVLKGLIDAVMSENELAMVLAHEIGHFQNRDHLRATGRGIVLMTLMAAVGMEGGGGFSDVLMSKSGEFVSFQFSQMQEEAADRFGLELLFRTYGHTGGAADFFDTLAEKKPEGIWAGWFSTHPTSSSRADTLRVLIEKNGWPMKAPKGMARSATFTCAPEKRKNAARL